MTNEEQILELLNQNQEILQKTYISAEKTRKYFLYTTIITILTFVLPILALVFYLPSFLSTFTDSMGGSVSF